MQDKRSIGRPREFDEDDVLQRLMDVFWRKGYEGTSLSDLVAASGLQKGSLYAAFGDKKEMFLKALGYYEKTVVDPAVEDLTRSSTNAVRRVRDFLNLPIEAAWANSDWRGCFLCNTAADHAERNSDTAELVLRGFDKLEGGLRTALAESGMAQKDARLCARTVLAVYSGLRVMVRSGRARPALEAARDGMLDLVRLKSDQ